MNNKTLAKNSLYNTLYSGFTVAFPLISITYLSKILLAEGIGKVEYARTVVTYFLTAASLGIPSYGVKIIAQAGNDATRRSRNFWEMFYLNFLSSIVCMIAYYIFITYNSYFYERRTLFYIMGSLLICNVANIDWYYQGIEEYVYITQRSIVIRVITFILMIFFVRDTSDYMIYAVFICLASIGNQAVNVWHLRKQISFVGFQKCTISRHVKPVLILFAACIATEIYTMLDTILIEYFHGEIYVGYYSNCVKIVRLVYTMSTAMTATLYPRISLLIREGKSEEVNALISMATKILIIFSIPASVGLYLVSDSIIIILLGDSFIPSVGCLRILSVLVVVFSFAYLLGHVILMASSNENRILFATLCGAGINTVLNIILIPSYRHYGAAIASVIAEILVTIMLLMKSSKIIKLSIEKSFVSSVLVATVIMIVSISIAQTIAIHSGIKLLLCILLGTVSYFSALIALRKQIIAELYTKVKRLKD